MGNLVRKYPLKQPAKFPRKLNHNHFLTIFLALNVNHLHSRSKNIIRNTSNTTAAGASKQRHSYHEPSYNNSSEILLTVATV